jgi:excisionase family DNA binding protein
MLTREQAADYLGVKPGTLEVWASTQRYALPYVKVGRCVRYQRADLDRFIEAQTVRPGGQR